MPDKPAYTRREFLGSSLAVISTAATVPAFIQRSAQAFGNPHEQGLASRPGFPDDRILVVVELTGGNDGMNTVIPFGWREYYDARPQLAVAENQVLRLPGDAGIGLHPGMQQIRNMINSELASIIQGVGYPNPNRSHFASMDIWHTADPQGGRGLGWIGKAMDHAIGASGASGTDCINLGRRTPLAAQAQHIKPISFESVEHFQWAGRSLNEDLCEAYDALNRAGLDNEPPADMTTIEQHRRGGRLVTRATGAGVQGDSQTDFLMRTALDAQVASDRVRRAVAQGTTTNFPGGALGSQLRMVASMIRAELPTNVYYTAMGGFDTHASQAGRHRQLLQQFSSSVNAFYRELKAIGQDHRVLTIAFSEFGRRFYENASQGTDHGTAGPMFIFGPMVRPGLLGDHPSMTRLYDDDLVYTVDFRSIYAGILQQWFQIDPRQVLGGNVPVAQLLRT